MGARLDTSLAAAPDGFELQKAHALTSLLSAGSDGAPVPPVMVDRFGGKAGVEEQYGGNSAGSLHLVACRISARDESGSPMPRSAKQVCPVYALVRHCTLVVDSCH